jgi:hypothetical protein
MLYEMTPGALFQDKVTLPLTILLAGMMLLSAQAKNDVMHKKQTKKYNVRDEENRPSLCVITLPLPHMSNHIIPGIMP